MALADITLADGQGTPVSHVFSYIATNGNRVIRSDLSAGPETPLLLTIAHSVTTIKGAKGSSHLFRIDRTILDADGVTPLTANARIMIDCPYAIMSDALADDFAAFLRNWSTALTMRLHLKNSVG